MAAASGGFPSVVTLSPTAAGGDAAGAGEEPLPSVATIDQFGLAFSPGALLLRAGGTLRFTNSEAALVHNVQVARLEPDSTVLNDDAAAGQAIEVVLDGEGAYAVTCEYHPGMTAFVYATTAPRGVVAHPDGTFVLPAPPGEYVLQVWSADPARRSERTIRIDAGATELDAAASR